VSLLKGNIVLSNSVSQSITLAVQSTAYEYVCDRLFAGNVGLNPGGSMYVFIVCLLCTV